MLIDPGLITDIIGIVILVGVFIIQRSKAASKKNLAM
ncbi:hypothetical protein SDC9_148278 [bioreactor metagenome]|uniref:Uncharacterized protein n=1 Tax=bioreactor metagenome TaxID=1076179 RepID=A0A645EGF1_9ZZZZ